MCLLLAKVGENSINIFRVVGAFHSKTQVYRTADGVTRLRPVIKNASLNLLVVKVMVILRLGMLAPLSCQCEQNIPPPHSSSSH